MKIRLVSAALITLAAVAALMIRPARAAMTPTGGGFVLIVNRSNPVTALPATEVSKIFLKKAELWPDGTPVAPVDLDESSPARDAFTRAVMRKSVAAVKSYWQQEIFAGREVPPPEQPTDADVVATVRGLPGAIGYVSPGTPLPGVKTVSIR